MKDDSTAALGAQRAEEEKLKGHVRSSVEETLNGLLDAEADSICCGFHASRPLIRAHAGPAFHAMPGRG